MGYVRFWGRFTSISDNLPGQYQSRQANIMYLPDTRVPDVDPMHVMPLLSLSLTYLFEV